MENLSGALPMKENIARRVPEFNVNYGICGHFLDFEAHILLQCPLALQIWEGRSLIEIS